MREEILRFLQKAKINEQQERQDFLIKNGISNNEYYDKPVEGCRYDAETKKFVKSTPLELTDEEYEAIEKYYQLSLQEKKKEDNKKLINNVSTIRGWVIFFGVLTIVSLIMNIVLVSKVAAVVAAF